MENSPVMASSLAMTSPMVTSLAVASLEVALEMILPIFRCPHALSDDLRLIRHAA